MLHLWQLALFLLLQIWAIAIAKIVPVLKKDTVAVFLIQDVNVHPKHANAERIVSVVIIAHVEAIVVANSLKDCILEVSTVSKMQS